MSPESQNAHQSNVPTSTALVPLDYARTAYNTLHGTELETHSDALTAEQAAGINNRYDLEVHVGLHGVVSEDKSFNPAARLELPTQKDYDQAAAVVAGMQPGDTLFVEGYGFERQIPKPPAVPESLLNSSENLFKQMLGHMAVARLEVGKAESERRLESLRHDYKISAFHYARELARLKGVHVVVADHDAFNEQSMQELIQSKYPEDLQGDSQDENQRPTQPKSVEDLMRSHEEEDRALAKLINARRERKAVSAVKDWALEHLSTEESPAPDGRKPKLVLLFGGMHEEGLKETFGDLGLDVEVSRMQSSSREDRYVEQTQRIMRDARAASEAYRS